MLGEDLIKNSLDQIMKNGEAAVDFTSSGYSFLMILKTPSSLNTEEDRECSHILEYNFMGLQWENLVKNKLLGRQEFCLVAAINNSVLGHINKLLETTEVPEIPDGNRNFTILYFTTDSTCLHVKSAYALMDAYLTSIDNDADSDNVYNIHFNSIPIVGEIPTNEAKKCLSWINENTIFEHDGEEGV